MNQLLEIEEKLMSEQNQTHITYLFNVSDSCPKLNIDFSYFPKSLDNEALSKEIIGQSLRKYSDGNDPVMEEGWRRFLPLKNLITVSIDDPNGFRGACHRQDSMQHLFLATGAASPGLMQGPLTAGQWSITLSIHALVTETCSYKLSVWEGDEAL
ncbi:hypothetical protein [Paenibacillus radicis (ex Xue et al. 2023)]|uniref:Uncharacterized protein n=1 Tax=Paenibacillus radicis (ex Xue et al. 2023) TaxID=2972489 RepID=A0ABT1YST5_9BACL|nr:hypothetical protein [Paenibacillus radicis (ex Xue et al. 2023)]MCR8636251.1 hypothetical protein [Paenibacillus radicis (ex Xue et al. 2023)]